ncbi:50S ribosomal protein L15 [Actinotalea sp. K2]|uniref:50S ribosomal protein L15 n=1 Tax=Actinotalea sp. K2 TaxID=2939438 RepID=UPI0020174B2D|nr:50S ribosomal protein L15 [Actinotalea sp. K2]MCL3860009.1 50S ribosomal protein L15 [Actinotalea sp. K2]
MADTKDTQPAEKPEKASAAKKPATKAAAEKKPAAKAAADKKPAAKAADKPATKAAAEKKPAAKAAADAPAAKESGAKASSTKAAASPAKKKAPAEGAGGIVKLHHLRPAPGAHTAKTRVGRGEASKGKTAGRGTKGQKARYQIPERFEGGQMPMHMRLPKLRGFKNPFRVEFQVVNLDTLTALYPKGGEVTVEDLVAKGAVRKGKPVKVLGTGELDVKLSVAVHAYSASAKDKILAAGGSVSED